MGGLSAVVRARSRVSLLEHGRFQGNGDAIYRVRLRCGSEVRVRAYSPGFEQEGLNV